jgi:uncharacterized protein YlxW (UPF0749 family)
MTDGERDKLHEMNGRLGGVEAAVKHFKETWQHQDEEATEGRRRLYDKLEELIKSVASLTFRVDQLTTEVGAIKPSVTDLTNVRQRDIGSKKMLVAVWSAIVMVIGAVSYSVIELAKLILGKHP